MNIDEYQSKAFETRLETANGLDYAILGLVSESGEVAQILKKCIRDNNGNLGSTLRHKLIEELGDVLWYVSAIADDLGISLSNVALHNLSKLALRHKK